MKITSTKEGLLLDADGDYIVSKNTMFDCRQFKGKLTVHGFSGSVGHNENTLVHLAEFMGYSKFQIKCIKFLLKLFSKKFEKNEMYLVNAE